MLQYLIDHPGLFAFAIPAIPLILVKIERFAVSQLLSRGDPIDQEAIKGVLKVLVVWAEKKGATDGAAKFAAVDRIVAHAIPFLTADQRKSLIEDAVKKLDDEAHNTIG